MLCRMNESGVIVLKGPFELFKNSLTVSTK